MSGRTVHITKNEYIGRVEARFSYDPDINPELKYQANARWDPQARCWWTHPWHYDDFVEVFADAGYDLKGDAAPPPPPEEPKPNVALETAVDKILYAVSPPRQHRLAKAIAAAAHPDGDSPDRPAAADELIRIATARLGDR